MTGFSPFDNRQFILFGRSYSSSPGLAEAPNAYFSPFSHLNARQFTTSSICSSTAAVHRHGDHTQDTHLHWQAITTREEEQQVEQLKERQHTGTGKRIKAKQSTSGTKKLIPFGQFIHQIHQLNNPCMSFTSVKAQRSATDAVASATAATVEATTMSAATVGRTASANLAPAVPSGFARRRNTIVGGLFGLAVLYHLVYNLVKDMDSYWFRPANEFCTDEHNIRIEPDGTKSCHRPDLFAFQVASGVMQLYMGWTGFWTWHVSRRVSTHIPQTSEGRLFGYLKEADYLNTAIFIYQTFDFFASMMVPEHCTAVFLTHHALAAFTAWMSLNFQMVHYYAIFFGGCSEISTIFLVLCDFDVYFPASHGSLWATIILICQVCFTFTFLYYRVIGWFQVSLSLWKDVLQVGRTRGAIEQYRPGLTWFVYTFLVMDTLLGLLQLYWWSFGIVPKIMEIASSPDDNGKEL